MWLGILLSVLAIGIGLAIGIPRGKKIKALRDQGYTVMRAPHYAEKGEQFTSRVGSCSAVKDGLLNVPLPCEMEGNVSTVVNFNSRSFAARLYRAAFDEQSGVAVYRFEFTRWKSARYGYEDETSMNMLMTSVEKVFLKLDPNTGVQSYGLNFKTRHSFI